MNYAPRISASYVEIQPVIQEWASKMLRMAVFQHDKDDSVQTTHCHILMEGCETQCEQLKRIFKKILPGLPAKGNEFWKWESKTSVNDSFLTYMSKGVLTPMFVKGYSPELVEERRLQWKITTPGKSPTSKYDEWEAIANAYDAQHDDYMSRTMSLDETRRWTFSWYYHRDGKALHISNYKRYAISLFIRSQNKKGEESFQTAVREAISLWY